ncbi:2033_t:CDS:1 [Funneliformis caledonium]|uniref:2033_t:CDS:1 n=1 Tax=Funneliformis caledonium TaxID=1117310 RepID=A0A9N9I7Q6_9GLOM|nr:2033_t:CDS:1 [Funneliformis caledonium]
MDNNPSSPTSLTFSANQKVPKLNQRQLTEIDTGNYSTGSLGHDQAATTNDASNSRTQLPEVPTDATYTKRESKSRLTSTPLMDRETYNLGHTGDQNYHRQYDQNYGDEATRHNTLTSGYPNHYENEYNDIDFPVVVKMHVNI